MEADEIKKLEIDLLLEAVNRRYGFDFRKYSRPHIERRLKGFLMDSDSDSVSGLIPRLLHDEAYFEKLLLEFSVTVTAMFRDPFVFLSIRNKVVPFLRTYPFIRVWVAGCATGEEAYSLAIVLREEGLEKRSRIYATDFNDSALESAREGIYTSENIRQATENYQQAGGIRSFADYYYARHGFAAIDSSLKENIVFANHNLITDGVFSEFHLILCRNVLIYFAQDLQDRALSLFSESLVRSGFLCLGANEEVLFSKVERVFEKLDTRARIFRYSGTPAANQGPESYYRDRAEMGSCVIDADKTKDPSGR